MYDVADAAIKAAEDTKGKCAYETMHLNAYQIFIITYIFKNAAESDKMTYYLQLKQIRINNSLPIIY